MICIFEIELRRHHKDMSLTLEVTRLSDSDTITD